MGFLLMSCKSQFIQAQSNHSTYSINEPLRTLELSPELIEVSGLTFSPNSEHICAINDEEGIIYFLNKKTGQIERTVKFNGQGDYEGIETVGEKIYIIKSTGTIFEVSDLEKAPVSSKKSKYILKKPNDSEGFAFDEKNNRLLVACKSAPCLHSHCTLDACNSKRAIYALDLITNKFLPDPIFKIDLVELQNFIKNNKTGEEKTKLAKFIKLKDNIIPFHPSALAIHPMTNDIYILSSKGKTMMVLDSTGKIIGMEKLDKKIHTQPEGIVFDKDGTMYISNEGKKGGNGTISIFDPK